jgi:hypothetical protein
LEFAVLVLPALPRLNYATPIVVKGSTRATPDNDYRHLYLDAQDDAQDDACTSYDYQESTTDRRDE